MIVAKPARRLGAECEDLSSTKTADFKADNVGGPVCATICDIALDTPL